MTCFFDNRYRNNFFVQKLFLWLFYIDLFLGLCPAWRGSFIFNTISYDSFMKIWLYGGIISMIFLSFIILCIQKKIYSPSIFYTTSILCVSFVFSILVNGFKSGAFAIIGIPLSYWVIFDILKWYQFDQKHLKRAFYALLLWSILPILYFSYSSVGTRLLFITGPEGNLLTFGGFAQHRNFYGIFLGVTFICTLIWKMKVFYKMILCILLSIGLVMSVCRTAILSIVVAMGYYLFAHPKISLWKKLFFLLLLLGGGVLIYLFLSDSLLAGRDISDNDDRLELWTGMIEIIKDNFWFGVGEEALYFSEGFPDGAPAHNFILAAWANYGIFVFLSFLFLLIMIFKYSDFYFKTFLIYLICWGITQPYFGCSVISIHILVPLFIGHLLDNNNQLVY